MSSLSRAVVMRWACFVLPALLFGVSPEDACARETAAMPPGAFLRHPVADVSALKRELNRDNLAVTRYSRLLRLSPAMVRTTFAGLHLTRLQRDMLLSVHYVHAGETIGSKVRRVRKGTPIFALPDGTPFLVKVCGNPLRGGDPRVQLRLRPSDREGPPEVARAADPDDVPDFDPTEPLNTPELPKPSSTITMRNAPPSLEVLPQSGDVLADDEFPADVQETGELLPAHTPAQAGRALAIWAGGGALIGVLAGGGGGHGVPVLPGITFAARELVPPLPGAITHGKSNSTPQLDTPEPGGLLMTAAVASALMAHFGLRRRKLRQRNSGAVSTVK